MESKAKILGHAAHPILIVFPLGLLSTAVVFDAVHLFTGTPEFATVSYWMIAAGLIGGIAAAPFGWYDWFAIPSGTRAKQVGLVHGLSMSLTLAIFFISWLLRFEPPTSPSILALVFSFAAVPLAFFGAWMGGELIERLGVGVDDNAHLNAPNSLTGTAVQASRAAADKS